VIAMSALNSTTRRNITLPEDVDEAMSAHPNINWSAIAVTAFRQKLDDLHPDPMKNIGAVIERLRKTRPAPKPLAPSVDAGQRWAARQATVAELERLAAFEKEASDGPGESWENFFDDNSPDHGGTTPAQSMAFRILGNTDPRDCRPEDAKEFWQRAIGGDPPPAKFAMGFAKGALDVWNEVKAEI
jgi:hypothetical protein